MKLISIITQLLASTTLAYFNLGFIHNDLHYGNVLVKKTTKPYFIYKFNNFEIKVKTHGIQIMIFDFDRATFTQNINNNYNDFSIQLTFFLSTYQYFLKIKNVSYITNKLNIFIPLLKKFHSVTNINYLLGMIKTLSLL